VWVSKNEDENKEPFYLNNEYRTPINDFRFFAEVKFQNIEIQTNEICKRE